MEPFKKTMRPGTVDVGRRTPVDLFVAVNWDGKRLSISGVEGPRKSGNPLGSCGQITESLQEIAEYAPKWNAESVERLREIWDTWHLNHMRAGCEHQRADGWHTRPINPNNPTNTHGKHFEGQRQDSWNLLTWVRSDEHPNGLLMKACNVCGYKYGSAWLTEEVPESVLEDVRAMPDSDVTPAWV